MKYLSIISVLLLSVFICFSCKDDEYYDFPGDDQNRIYFKTVSNTVNEYDKIKFEVLQTPNGVFSGKLEIPVYSTMPADGDIFISLEADESLVADFNSNYDKDYKPFPVEAVSFSNNELRIPSNTLKSEGVFDLKINPDLLGGVEPGEYLLPLKIGNVNGNAAPSTNRNKVYIIITLSLDEDNIWNTAIDDKGSLYKEDRQGWEVTAFNSEFSGDTNLLFDGDESQRLRYYLSNVGESESGFIVDMKNPIVLSGIYEKFYWSSYAISKSEIYTSLDNQDWTYQGAFEDFSDLSEIIFYTPVEARYIKIVVKDSSRYSFYINEFNVYVKE